MHTPLQPLAVMLVSMLVVEAAAAATVTVTEDRCV